MADREDVRDPHVSLIRPNEQRKYKVPLEGHNDSDFSRFRRWLLERRHRRPDGGRLSTYDHFAKHIPMLGWVRSYKPRQYLLWDLLAGASVAALVVPQGMAYAALANLPPVWGLYGAFVPVLCYAALGSSKHLAVGPVAVTSLLLGSQLPKIAPKGTHAYEQAAIQVAIIAGIIYSAIGIFRLGFLTNFLSHSVISGFTTGASVLIALTQLKTLFGYNSYNPGYKVLNKRLARPPALSPSYLASFSPANAPKYAPGGFYAPAPTVKFPSGGNDPVYTTLGLIFSREWLNNFAWREFLMGVCWLIILFACKEIGKSRKSLVYIKAAGPLLVVVLSISIVSIFRLYDKPHNIQIVGKIPAGLPHQTVTWWFPIEDFGVVGTTAVLVCLIDILESISIAKALAYKNNYILDPTQELRGLGLANIVGAAFNCYTTTGSFSRSAIMDSVGARTQLAGITSGIIVMVVLLFLTPLFTNMPKTAQAAIIVSAVLGLFNWQEWWFLWKINKIDWVIFNVAALGTMFLGVELGLAISIGLSIVMVLVKSAFPHTAVLGQLPDTTVYRNVKQYPEAATIDGVLVVRIDAPIYFANVNPVRDTLEKYEQRARTKAISVNTTLQFVVLDLSPVTDIDGSGVHFLSAYIRDERKKGIQVILANPSTPILRRLEIAGIPELIGPEHIVVRTNDAVLLVRERLAEQGGPLKADKESPTAREPYPDPKVNGQHANGKAI